MIAALLPYLALQQSVDPNLLRIGPDRTVEARLNTAINTNTGSRERLEDIAAAVDGKRFVYVGETHDSADAHRWQTNIIGALVERGRNVIVGLEMYQRPSQRFLDMWTLGWLTEEEFLKKSDWKRQWGFDFALYRPIFDFVQRRRLRCVALNIPRAWVSAVGRGGPAELPPEARAVLPELYLDNRDHRAVFEALMQAHPPGGMMENMYAAQVLWDEAMADSVLKYLERTTKTGNTVFVVLAGNGHLIYKQGINYRILRRTGMDGITVITVEIPKARRAVRVRAGIGDFVVGTRAAVAKPT